jgi:hypothetical protein
LLCVPAMSRTFREQGDAEAYNKRQTLLYVKKGQQLARTAFNDLVKSSPFNLVKKFALRFPDKTKLSQAVFGATGSSAARDGGMVAAADEMIVYKVDTVHRDANDQVIYSLKSRQCWQFVDLGTAKKVHGRDEGAKKKVAAAFGGM